MSDTNRRIPYRFVYIDTTKKKGKAQMQTIELHSIRALAKYLNAFVKRNPQYQVMIAFIIDKDGCFKNQVRFLKSEFSAQKWLTGYNERFLAYAKEVAGIDIKWNPSHLSSKNIS